MPNHVTNVIKAKGIGSLPIYSVDDDGEKILDFNKIIPMPDALNIENGPDMAACVIWAVSNRGAKRYSELTSWDRSILRETLGRGSYEATELDYYCSCVRKLLNNPIEDAYDRGVRYIENQLAYGAPTWYRWCLDHWGTKWNAYELHEDGPDQIRFQTAWSSPAPIITKLAKMYPDLEIEHWWADEHIGHNTGHAMYKGDQGFLNSFVDESQAAFDTYIFCWSKSNCLYQNEHGQWIRRDCEDCPGCDA